MGNGNRMHRCREWRRGAITLAATAAFVVTPLTQRAEAATIRFDNAGGDGLWETGANWVNGTTSTHGTVPSSADVADISNVNTVSLTSAQTVTEMQVGFPNSSASTVPGTATLNVGA